MSSFSHAKNKANLSKIGKKAHTFIDKNLQIHLSTKEMCSLPNEFYTPIYAHYASYSCDDLPLPSFINEKEIDQGMKEAEHLYKTWKKIKQKILNQSKNASF